MHAALSAGPVPVAGVVVLLGLVAAGALLWWRVRRARGIERAEASALDRLREPRCGDGGSQTDGRTGAAE